MIEFNTLTLHNALTVLGEVLSDKNLHFEVVAVGGGGLLLLGMITRSTRDVDLVALIDKGQFISAKQLPSPLLIAIAEVGKALQLGENWVNSAPFELFSMGLPDGFADRMSTYYFGGLTLHLASRFDQICFKLYASTDHTPDSKHFADLKSLKPTSEELERAANWCKTHDVSEPFAIELSKVLGALEN